MNYFALIGDTIDSKKIDNHYQVQRTSETYPNELNIGFKDVLVSKLSITLGDEFQELLTLDAPLFQITDRINFTTQSYQVRFGLDLGKILTDTDPEQSIGVDGPACWHARKAINYIYQKNGYSNTQIAVSFEDDTKVSTINILITSSEAAEPDWRVSQEAILQKLLKFGTYDEHFDQQILGEQLELSTSTLSKRLKSSNIKVYLRTRNCVLDLLRNTGGELN